VAVEDATVVELESPSFFGRVRAHSFGPASEEPYRRRVSDWIRLGVGASFLCAFIVHQGDQGPLETELLRTIRTFPHLLASPVRLLYGLGALWAVGLVVAAVVARRRRLVRDLLVGGAATWGLSRVVAGLAGASVFSHSLDVFIYIEPRSTVFPALRVAMLVGVIAVASPYLTRPVRRVGHVLVLLMLFAAMYIGASFNEVAAGLVLGWTVAAGVHLLFGSPGGRPTAAQVRAALTELGVPVHDVMLAPNQPTNATHMLAYDDRGALRARVLGRDEADAQFLAKFWRWLLYREGGPAVHLTRLEDVQSEAYCLLLAQRAGVRVAEVVVGGIAGPGTALLLTRRPDGAATLADVDPDAVTDAVLADLWTQVRKLHAAHVAHGRLNTHHVMLGREGVALVDFERSSGTGTTIRRQEADVAELLASTAQIVGNERAARAALDNLGPDAVVAALPLLQPAALSHELRRSSHHRRELANQLAGLREVVAADAGTTPPPLQDMYRVKPANLLMAVGTLIGLIALFSQVGNPGQLWHTFTNADVTWLVVALVGVLLTNFPCAIALMGTVPINLPLIRTTELQLSMSFANLAVPAVGGNASQVRFLQKQGMDLAGAVASGGLLATAANLVAQLGLLVVALQLRPPHYHGTGQIDAGKLVQLVLILILAVAVVGGLAVGIPRLRRLVVTPAKSAMATLWAVLRSPRRVFLMLSGNIVNTLMSAAVYLACLAAVGGSVNFWTLLSLNIVIGTIASLIPIPGGGTAVSSVGMSGALAAAGVPIQVAVAAALINQIVVNFIPAVPGWFATNDLLHADYL
jgi:undecaprenyl-diphosphatase